MDNVQPYLRCQGWEHELTLVDHLNISIDHMLSICPTSDSSPKYRICRTRFCSWCWHLWAFVRHKAHILELVAAVIQHMTQKMLINSAIVKRRREIFGCYGQNIIV